MLPECLNIQEDRGMSEWAERNILNQERRWHVTSVDEKEDI